MQYNKPSIDISTEYNLMHQALKKGAALCKMASTLKYSWQPRNGRDGRSVTKILITTIQVLIRSEAGMRQHKLT